MALLRTLNNNNCTSLSGKVLETSLLPKLEFEINSDRMVPPSINPNIEFRSSVANTIFIDYGDGSPVVSYDFANRFTITQGFYIYPYSAVWKITIWFKFPTKITAIDMFRFKAINNFPLAIGLYALNSLIVRETSFSSFPIALSGGVFNTLQLVNVTPEIIREIPNWILGSKISTLGLGSGFNFSSIHNLDRLNEISGLVTLALADNGLTKDNIPLSIGNIAGLKRLVLGANPITEINTTINGYRQIEQLEFGYEPAFSGNINYPFSSWGVGITNMINLKNLHLRSCPNIPATLPTGLESAPLCKTIQLDSCYRNTDRVNAIISDAYNRVIVAATMSNVNTQMRGISLNVGWINSAAGGAPALGTYQAPTGYVQGTSNGSPANTLEMVYVLVKQYGWRITVLKKDLTANQTYIP